MRDFNARLVAPILKATGFRFSKLWRVTEGTFRNFIFRNVLNTTKANQIAEGY